MTSYFIVKTLHIISATVLFGTGLGIAFFMLRAWFTQDVSEKYFAAKTTVLADYCFTLPAVILQPLSGAWLVWKMGYGWTDLWLMVSYSLYVLAGLCWLPVVVIQIRLRNIIKLTRDTGSELPKDYTVLFRWWFALGWPAFFSLVAIFFVMVSKPQWQ